VTTSHPGAALTGKVGWAVVGPGRIAHRFAEVATKHPGARLAAVQGRDAERARAFAEAWRGDGDAPAVHTDLDALLRDRGVDAVYVATPHAFHADAVRRALEAGKPVLCEKSLTPNAALTRELCALSQARGVFLMEAVWTRFLPAWAQVGEWLSAGAIGAVRGIQSSFCFDPPYDPGSRLFDPAQAGGAMLDIGVYNLTMSQWVLQRALGACPPLARMDVHGSLAPTGVEQRVAATLVFEGGVASQFQCGFDGRAPNTLQVLGARGHIVVCARFWEATRVELHVGDAPPVIVERHATINGFEGEVTEAMRCIAEGLVESPTMPHADTIVVAEWMDAIRARLGVHDPFAVA
jgi:predicted dehydrogenase